MALTLNSNIASSRAQRQLLGAGSVLEQSRLRLATGQRINRASDDAASLSIGMSLNLDSRVLDQGVRNLRDGTSALAIAEGALGEMSNIGFRLGELSEAAANGTLSLTQRGALDREADVLVDEYNRISAITQFNGLSLIDGSLTNLTLQAGYGSSAITANIGRYMGVGTTDGTFKGVVSTDAAFAAFPGIITGDFNKDGHTDIGFGSSALEISLGNGDGTFQSRRTFSGISSDGVTTGDFNGDGNLDVIGVRSGFYGVYSGNADGTFSSQPQIALAGVHSHVATVDLNGDGILDIALNDTTSDAVLVALGNGNGTFKAVNTFSTGAGTDPATLVFGDFNRDGKYDLAAANYGSTTVSVFLGNGDGRFGGRSDYTVGINPGFTGGLTAADVNQDDILDLLTADRGSNTVSVLIGNSDGTFAARVSYSGFGISPGGIVVGDVNGDTFLDVVTNSEDNTIRVALGVGNGTFKATISSALGGLGRAVTLADFNEDKALDIATINESSSRAQVVFGNRTGYSSMIARMNLTSRSEALKALDSVRVLRGRLTSEMANIGSFDSRTRTAISALESTAESYRSAASQINDADVATEVATVTRTSILQQAAASILAQANLQPRLVLDLIQG